MIALACSWLVCNPLSTRFGAQARGRQQSNASRTARKQIFTRKVDHAGCGASVPQPHRKHFRCGLLAPVLLRPRVFTRESTAIAPNEYVRDELRHLEHADLALAVEYGPHRVVGVDFWVLFVCPGDRSS